MKVVVALLTEEERNALVGMLEHEHFAYGDDGVLALAGYKNIRDAPSTDQRAGESGTNASSK